jgi:phospholipid transport system substrate-binding protein
MKKILSVVTLLILFFSVPSSAAEEIIMPDVLARQSAEKILELLRANLEVYEKDHEKLYAMVREQILPHFDFRAISKLVLGRYWREASEDQRQRFANEFRDLLVRTYATALLKFNDEEIIFLPFKGKPTDKLVVVKTVVKRADGGPNVPITYNLFRKNNAWKIYDVTIEGVSLVTNYRSVYSEKIKKDGLDALIVSLAQSTTSEHAIQWDKKK